MEPSKTSGKQANPKISSSTKMENSALSLSEHLLRQIGAIRMSQSWRGSVTIRQAANGGYTVLLHQQFCSELQVMRVLEFLTGACIETGKTAYSRARFEIDLHWLEDVYH